MLRRIDNPTDFECLFVWALRDGGKTQQEVSERIEAMSLAEKAAAIQHIRPILQRGAQETDTP